MYRYVVIALLVVFMALSLVFGIPLNPETQKPDFAANNIGKTTRCMDVGDLDGYIKCMVGATGQAEATHGFFSLNPRLTGFDLARTVAGHLDMMIFPFGYLFTFGLAAFLAISILLILMMKSDEPPEATTGELAWEEEEEFIHADSEFAVGREPGVTANNNQASHPGRP